MSQAAAKNPAAAKPVIAIFPWGDVIEEFLDPIGLTLDDFVEHMTGGWLFGYVAALQYAGWSPIIVAASEHISATTRFVHAASGAVIWIVPGKRATSGRSPALNSIRRWLATPLQAFAEVIERQQCNALLIQEYEYTRFDVLVRLAARRRIPAYASFQGGDRTLSWIERIVRGRSLSLCSGLIIASVAERSRVKHTYRHCHPRITAIPNPLDCDEWIASDRIQARQTLGIAADAFIVINHGRIDIWRKGLDVLIAAWATLDIGELVIIGSGQDHAAFAELLAKSAARNVRWIADYTTDRRVIRQWLSAADIYVTASRIEGMPVAPLEAMACGLPIIASDANGLPDILDGGESSGGIVVPRENVAALAAAIKKLHTDAALRAQIGRAARARIETMFSVSAAGLALSEFLLFQQVAVTLYNYREV